MMVPPWTAAILPGDGRKSYLVQRLRGEGDEDRMPLDADPLPAATIARLRAWIDQGAPMPGEGVAADASIDEHWAYVKPARPDLPPVGNTGWVRNPIDYFIAARLETARLDAAPEADRRTLARRVSLDLTGLPPSPAPRSTSTVAPTRTG